MTPEKDKAESYVRKAIPELMELSFVSLPNSGDHNKYKRSIQLNHWLRMLPWDTTGLYFLPSGCLCDKNQQNKVVMVFDMKTGQPATEADYKAFNVITANT